MDKATGKFSVESITVVRMFSYYLLDFHELFKLEKTLFYLIPILIGFAFAILYWQPKLKKTFFRKIFLALWAANLVYIIYELLLRQTSFISPSRVDARPTDIAIIALVLVAFSISCVVSYFFKPRKIWSWLYVVLLSILSYVGFSYIYWIHFREPVAHIDDKVLTETSRYDYEIIYEETFGEVVFDSDDSTQERFNSHGDNAYFPSYYAKGDSVYFCYRYRKCDGITWRVALENKRDTTFSIEATEMEPCIPKLINREETAKIQKLKKDIDRYQQEYSANHYLDGSYLYLTLNDYGQKKVRKLFLGNPDESVPKALEIFQLVNSLRPADRPQKRDFDDECRERSKALDALMEEYGQAHSDRGKYLIY
ncbi:MULTISPECIES: hypothetical protein [unclassified Fibrobacter]|uniref:hypothetical protein n=1 Tax=unclassified Fibrobacter TaxID=2634177 RepID=UPI000B51F09F|nr:MULTISPECIES: hypothetical protein [unclassified Fibrobacter]OWV04105.1 hypothetical protein B7993_11780 [Fibrobacter sp. UWH3]